MNKPTPSSLPVTTKPAANVSINASGYHRDIDWMPVYQPSLNPNHVEFVMAANGQMAPKLSSACEIAYGVGYSLVLHAACNASCQFSGTDFNPRHHDFANRLSDGLGLKNLTLHGQSIEDFCKNDHDTVYDFIGLTGTWSWLPDENQKLILEFASTCLSETGNLCFDYMTRPGSDATTAMRKAMMAYLAQISPGSTTPDEAATKEVQRYLLEFANLQPAFLKSDRRLKTILEKAQENPSDVFVHEYLNFNWQPVFFSDMNDLMAQHDLHWTASCRFGSMVPDVSLMDSQQAHLLKITDRAQREQVRDLLLNASGRMDLWSRSITTESNLAELVAARQLVLAKPALACATTYKSSLGEFRLNKARLEALLAALDDLRPASIAEIADRVAGYMTWQEMIQLCLVLADNGCLAVANIDQDEILQSVETARRLNSKIIELTAANGKLTHLGSPVTGGGIEVSGLHQLFLLARQNNHSALPDIARFANDIVLVCREQDQSSFGTTDLSNLEAEAAVFTREYLPIYQALKLV